MDNPISFSFYQNEIADKSKFLKVKILQIISAQLLIILAKRRVIEYPNNSFIIEYPNNYNKRGAFHCQSKSNWGHNHMKINPTLPHPYP